MQDSSSPTSGTPAHEAGSPAAAAAAGADADVEEDEFEDECEEESEEDSQEEGDGSFVPTTDIDAKIEVGKQRSRLGTVDDVWVPCMGVTRRLACMQLL
jgi:hypothetical protein